jgi:hypothetical protein
MTTENKEQQKALGDEFLNRLSEVPCHIGGEKGLESRGRMSLFGVLRLRFVSRNRAKLRSG